MKIKTSVKAGKVHCGSPCTIPSTDSVTQKGREG
jgi:hypothetical protein